MEVVSLRDNYKLLIHGWGTTPAQKRKEAEYNRKYYREHKEKWQKTQSAYEKRASDTEKLVGKQDANTYSAKTKLHIRRTPKNVVNETDYVKDYVKRNSSIIEKELIDEWKKRNPPPDSGNFTKEGIEAYVKYNEKLDSLRSSANREARRIAEQRAKEAYSRIHSETEDRIQARKIRTQEINDAKAANEASKAEQSRIARNSKLAKRDSDLAYYTNEAKKAKRQAAKMTMLEYQAELDSEKYAPLHKKAKKFVDGTVEVALDNAKNALSKLKTPNDTSGSKKDNKKKINEGKAWLYKHLGLELF